MQLLKRKEFREAVFKRDRYKCVVCGKVAVDAHHILERRLWSDGGYYLDNGASLCARCHWWAETTRVSVKKLRNACGISKPIIPDDMYSDVEYDKWGNIILSGGFLLRGELFYDESVQKALTDKLHLFKTYVKYPRTHHLPWSQGMHDDDRMIKSMDAFEGQGVVVTEKMDGECTSLYSDHIHARSITSNNHQSRDWVKNFWSQIKHDIPEGWRICGENLYATHSVRYLNLPSYFMGFSMWNDRGDCLGWDETLEWFELLDVIPVPVIYEDIYDEEKIESLWNPSEWATKEGYVLRTRSGFSLKGFRKCVGKFVRKCHVQTAKHWMYGQEMEVNSVL